MFNIKNKKAIVWGKYGKGKYKVSMEKVSISNL